MENEKQVFYKTAFKLALPIVIQQFIFSSLSMIDVIMVGQLGEVSIAALGLAGQITFLYNLVLFGLSSGISIFTAQYWGKRDIPNIRRILGIGYFSALIFGLLFTILCLLIPDVLMSFYTKDVAVIDAGASYLRINGISFLFFGIAYILQGSMRSTEEVRVPVGVSIGAVILKTCISYLLVFGIMGFPALGIKGTATGTVIASVIELFVLMWITYSKDRPQAANISTLFDFDFSYFKGIFRIAFPALVNEIFYSLGITIYNSIYAHIDTSSIAAININSTFENMSFVFLISIGNACAIMIGNQIGAKNEGIVEAWSKRFLIISTAFAFVIGGLIVLLRGPILSLYNIQPITYGYAKIVILFSAILLPIRANNFLLFIGLIRSGGDTKFGMILEIISLWLLGIPLGLVSAFVLNLPVYFVYLIIGIEEVNRLVFVYRRYRSGKWINNLVETTNR
ncbi:MAG: MATE family efflux transporter [Anaerolineales bacterium]|nr:MATE family efflux transporter [Anaerolineales bacterium]